MPFLKKWIKIKSKNRQIYSKSRWYLSGTFGSENALRVPSFCWQLENIHDDITLDSYLDTLSLIHSKILMGDFLLNKNMHFNLHDMNLRRIMHDKVKRLIQQTDIPSIDIECNTRLKYVSINKHGHLIYIDPLNRHCINVENHPTTFVLNPFVYY